MKTEEITPYWTKKANNLLAGRTIVKVEYLDTKEAKDYGWYKRPISFTLDDGKRVIAQMDDEGNDGGALCYLNDGVDDVLPVLSIGD